MNATTSPLRRALILLCALAVPMGLAAESAHTTKHHHYKLIDIGTFGGPSSFFDDLHLTDNFGFGTVFYNFSQVRNSKGVLVGFADTPTPDPNSANPLFCYVPDCFVTHVYAWQSGAKAQLSTSLLGRAAMCSRAACAARAEAARTGRATSR